ncbi:MAG: hypothetical protein EOM03_12010 [Clostridia bacterium]|nr:hypothetical protein [Clostridia bacterium]
MTQHENQLPTQVQQARTQADEMMKALFAQSDTADKVAADDATQDTGDKPTLEEQPKHENWEAKFHTLQGKYNAEVPRLNDLARQQAAEIQRLTSLVEAKQEQPPATAPAKTTLNREALEAYDDEFGKLVDLIEAQKAEIDVLKSTLGQVQGNVQQVGQHQQATATDMFWRELRAAVPDFDAINADPAFVAWLNEPDGLSETPRKVIGDTAMKALNHEKVARIIKEFKSQRGKQQPKPQVNLSPSTTSVNHDLHTQQMQQGAVYGRDEISDFYRKVQDGFPFKWRNEVVADAARAAAIRIEIQQAGIEGRIA